MEDKDLAGVLEFLRNAERLKDVNRSSWTGGGSPESVAAHTWRLCLMATVLAPEFPELDAGKLLKMCIVHDLGEALSGDVPAVDQDPSAPKSDSERLDLQQLLEPLPAQIAAGLLELWDEYEGAASPEARIAKALDKLETIMQHNQGANPASFNYEFNLDYGARYTSVHPLTRRIRALLDEDTRRRMVERSNEP
ncbi:MAG TPA: HD domain-containing protein [Longimicrobiales bacterium]|nr:HD domain-containing protein [Longimicrobiales bacterium]